MKLKTYFNFFKIFLNYFSLLFFVIFLYYFNFISFHFIFFSYLTYCFFIYNTIETEFLYKKDDSIFKEILTLTNLKKFNFRPYFLFPFTFTQFILLNFSRKTPKRKIITTKENVNDEGTKIQWVQYDDENLEEKHKNKPLLLIFPGITGVFEDTYCYNLCIAGLDNDYDVVLYLMRTLSDEMNLSKGYFDYIEDIEDEINLIKKRNKNTIFAIGGSFGANCLAYYLGTKNVINKKINYAVCISGPYNYIMVHRFGTNTLFEYLILYFEKKNYLIPALSTNEKYYNLKKKKIFDINIIKSANSVSEFDQEFFAKVTGNTNKDDFYLNISSYKLVKNINIPTLFIHSKDDPICTFDAVPEDFIKENKNTLLIKTEYGGHLCFIENNSFFTNVWIINVIEEFFNYFKIKK